MRCIRTVLVTLPKLLRGVIVGLALQIDPVAVLDTREALPDRLRVMAPDLVIIGLRRDEDPGIGETLRAALLGAATLLLAHDRGRAWLYGRDGGRRTLDDVSAAELRAALVAPPD